MFKYESKCKLTPKVVATELPPLLVLTYTGHFVGVFFILVAVILFVLKASSPALR